jgi:superfamily II DNA helicase RecQ
MSQEYEVIMPSIDTKYAHKYTIDELIYAKNKLEFIDETTKNRKKKSKQRKELKQLNQKLENARMQNLRISEQLKKETQVNYCGYHIAWCLVVLAIVLVILGIISIIAFNYYLG